MVGFSLNVWSKISGPSLSRVFRSYALKSQTAHLNNIINRPIKAITVMQGISPPFQHYSKAMTYKSYLAFQLRLLLKLSHLLLWVITTFVLVLFNQL